MSPTIVVVIPAYRAETHIGAVLAGIPEFVRHIVVVDDRSPDDTASVVRAATDSRVRLVSHEENQGVGGAMLTGYEEAVRLGADIIVKMDSDDQMDPAYMAALIAPVVRGQADYAKGNRFLHMRQLTTMPITRRIGNIGLSFLTKIASGYWNIFDPTNGYTAIHASVAKLLSRDSIARRYFYETSMLLELNLLRAVVKDVYIPARYGDEVSSLSVWGSLVTFPSRLLVKFFARIGIQYFVRDFSAVSVLLIAGLLLSIFGVVWGGYHWMQSAIHDVSATTGAVMMAVLPLILGMQLLLQALILDIQSVPDEPLQCDLVQREEGSIPGLEFRRPRTAAVGDSAS